MILCYDTVVKSGVEVKEVWAENPVTGDGWGIPLHRGSSRAHCPWGYVPGAAQAGPCCRKSITVRTEWKLRVDRKTLISHPGDSPCWFPFQKEGYVAAPVQALPCFWCPWPRCEPGWEGGQEEGMGVNIPWCSWHQGICCPDVALPIL